MPGPEDIATPEELVPVPLIAVPGAGIVGGLPPSPFRGGVEAARQRAVNQEEGQRQLEAATTNQPAPLSEEQALDIPPPSGARTPRVTSRAYQDGSLFGVVSDITPQQAADIRARAPGFVTVAPDGSLEFAPEAVGAVRSVLGRDVVGADLTSLAGEGALLPEAEAPVPTGPAADVDAVMAASASLGALGNELQQMQQAALVGQLSANDLRSRGFEALGALRNEQRRQAQEMGDERMAEYDRRVRGMEQAIQDVSNRRVDPEAFYGGDFGRRLAATIGVALGQLGSSIGGGPNTALQILERRIQQNIQTQQADLDNARAGISNQNSALAHFRQLLGDERAALAATHAAEMDAAMNALEARVQSSQNPVLLANGQAAILQGRISQMRSLVDAYTGALPRGGRAAVARAELRSALPASQELTGQRRPARPRVAAPGSQAPQAAAAAPEAPTHLPGRGFAGLEPSRVERFATTSRAAGEGAGAPPTPHGLSSTDPSINPGEQFARWSSVPQAQQRIVGLSEAANLFDQHMPTMMRIARELSAVGLPTERRRQLQADARTAALALQASLRQSAQMGAPQAFEHELVSRVAAAPHDESTWRDLTEGMRRGTLRGLWLAQMRSIDSALNTYGFRTRSVAGAVGN